MILIFALFLLQFNIAFLTITSFWSLTALETVLPNLIAVLELRFWYSLRLVSYNLLNFFKYIKMSSFEVISQYWKGKSHKASSQVNEKAEKFIDWPKSRLLNVKFGVKQHQVIIIFSFIYFPSDRFRLLWQLQAQR